MSAIVEGWEQPLFPFFFVLLQWCDKTKYPFWSNGSFITQLFFVEHTFFVQLPHFDAQHFYFHSSSLCVSIFYSLHSTTIRKLFFRMFFFLYVWRRCRRFWVRRWTLICSCLHTCTCFLVAVICVCVCVFVFAHLASYWEWQESEANCYILDLCHRCSTQKDRESQQNCPSCALNMAFWFWRCTEHCNRFFGWWLTIFPCRHLFVQHFDILLLWARLVSSVVRSGLIFPSFCMKVFIFQPRVFVAFS